MISIAKPVVGADEGAAVARVLASGSLAQGGEVAAFEEEFGSVVDGRRCIAVNSGTAALHLGLMAIGLRPGDEVIVPSFTFAATANAVVLAGGIPVFADIDPETYCLDAESVAAAITTRTVGIMPVHLYGHPADMPALEALGERHGLFVFEDAAQAHGATLHGRAVGAMGTMAAFSFYPTKNMTSGEGGMIVTDDPQLERTARLLRNQGMERRYENEIVGFNARMTDIHAAVGRVQLAQLPSWTARRQATAAWLDDHLTAVATPMIRDGATHVFHQYTVRSTSRDALVEQLQAAGVGCGVYYPIPVHALPSFGLECDLPATRLACDEVLSLPVHPSLSQDDLAAIAQGVNA